MNKNKKVKAISGDNLKPRCSSLDVNLSYTSDLTDSGNESLKQTDTGCTNNASECFNSKQTFVNHTSLSYNIPLKNISVILNKISHDDVILNKHCEKLKYAILTKTKQMFDKQDELLVKTCTILSNKENQLDITLDKNVVHTIKGKNMSAMSSDTNEIIFQNREVSLNQNIKSTPKDRYKNKPIEKQWKQKKLKKRCLFSTKKQSCDISINNYNVHLKPGVSPSKGKCHIESGMITEVNQSFCTLNVSLDSLHESVSSIKKKDRETDELITFKNQSFSILNISEHENTFTATPIACSTMIDGNAKTSGTEDEILFQAANNLFSNFYVHAEKDTTSMEITDVCGGFIVCDKLQPSVKCITKDVSPFVESSLLQINSNCKELINETSKKFIKPTDKDIEKDTNVQWNNINMEPDSANTVQTSLNVNTSLDLISQSSTNADKFSEKQERKICKNYRNKYIDDTQLEASKEVQKSINTVCTSLQMNTSLNTSSMLRENNSINKGSEMKITNMIDMHRTQDINLTKDFENVLTLCNMSNCFNNESAETKEKDRINSTTISNQYNHVVDHIHSNEQSYIEATPYPMCRSVMLQSLLKQNADTHLNAKLCFLEQEVPVVSINSSKEQEEIKNNMVILNSSSSKELSTKIQTSVVIKKMTNENNLKEDINAQKVDKKKCKKKLMPLYECSQLSLSPVEKQYSPPEYLIIRKKIKSKNKCNKLNVNSIQYDKKQKRKDCSEEKTKVKKPRKVNSKKIIVKKIVDQDILRKLQESRENFNEPQINMHSFNTNSSNDFQSSKQPSTTQFTKKKAHKIYIVTTGLSNEDKSMVKSVVKALGSAKVESNVTKRTTHVVTTGVRTINLLHGIIRGCWLVSLEWILKSLENNTWLNPEEYEMTHFSKAVLENRKDRQLFGSSYIPELFATCGYIYIEKNTTPPCNVLKDLVKAAGGCITENPKVAKVMIGTESLKESWVLDCITSGELQPYNQYQRY